MKEHDYKLKSMQKEEFDIFTKVKGSPSKNAKRAEPRPDIIMAQLSGKYNREDLVPENLDR